MKTRKLVMVGSVYCNLTPVRVYVVPERNWDGSLGAGWVVPERTLRRINRHGAGDYFHYFYAEFTAGEREALEAIDSGATLTGVFSRLT